MYAFVDETGNTGNRLLDDDQPLFITGALMTRSDFDQRFTPDIVAIAASLGEEEIHASRLGLGRVEEIARDLLDVVRKAGPAFFLARVEKRYVLASKVYDTLFDSFENKAVPWHYYNVRPLRIALMFRLATLIDDASANIFWDALMETNSVRAREKMTTFCKGILGHVALIHDARARQVIADGLDWAAQNPAALHYAGSDKFLRRSHAPNMVGFGNVLGGIERQSATWNYPVEVIRHDRQNEFAAAIEVWHKMYSNARADVVELPLGEKMVLRKVFGSRLEITSAKESAGIQTIDTILWLFSRALRGDDIPPNCQALLDYVYSRAQQDDFSFDGVSAATEALIEQIESAELSLEDLERGRRLNADIERRRIAAMADFAASHAKSSIP